MNGISLVEILNPRPWTVFRAETQVAALLRGKPLLTEDEAKMAIQIQRAINFLKHNEGSIHDLRKEPSEEDLLYYFERRNSGYTPRKSFTEGLCRGMIF
jgi:hypothetical protein